MQMLGNLLIHASHGIQNLIIWLRHEEGRITV